MRYTMKRFKVEGMSCSHCEKAVIKALEQTEGVSETQVDMNEKTVTVKFDSDVIEEAGIIDAIEDAGYYVA